MYGVSYFVWETLNIISVIACYQIVGRVSSATTHIYYVIFLLLLFSTKKDLFSIIKRVNLEGFGILHKTILIPSKALPDDW